MKELAGIVLVTCDDEAAELAQRRGLDIVTDRAEGHTGAVMSAARMLAAAGKRGLLSLPGDVPGATTLEIAGLLAAHPEGDAFSIVPSRDRRGSNAIVLTPPDALPLSYGNDSFVPYLEAGARARVVTRVLRAPGLELDIDNPEDIFAFMAAPSPTRSWAFLAESGVVSELPARKVSR